MLVLSLVVPSNGAPGDNPIWEQVRTPPEYADACGPMAIVSYCAALGFSVSMAEAVEQCQWTPQGGATCSNICAAISHFSKERMVVRDINVPGILAVLRSSRGPIVVPIQRDGARPHVVVVLGEHRDGRLVVIDPPEMLRLVGISELENEYLGFIISIDDARVSAYSGPAIFAGGGLAAAFVSSWWRRRSTAASSGTP